MSNRKDVSVALLGVLRALLDDIEDCVDVVDGADGTPRPNWAMRLMTDHGDRAREIIKMLEGEP